MLFLNKKVSCLNESPKEWYFDKVHTMFSDLFRLAMNLLFDSDNRADLMKNRYLSFGNYS